METSDLSDRENPPLHKLGEPSMTYLGKGRKPTSNILIVSLVYYRSHKYACKKIE